MPLKIHDDEPPALNLIPMIDIMFNVIIFLLVTSRFASIERDIPLRVPEVVDKGALTEAPERRVINIFRDGKLTLDEAPVTLEELVSRLTHMREQYPDLGVLVRGDGRGEFQPIARVLNACKQAGIQELGISVRPVAPDEERR
jgi:biopolymer transport protein ExbD